MNKKSVEKVLKGATLAGVAAFASTDVVFAETIIEETVENNSTGILGGEEQQENQVVVLAGNQESEEDAEDTNTPTSAEASQELSEEASEIESDSLSLSEEEVTYSQSDSIVDSVSEANSISESTSLSTADSEVESVSLTNSASESASTSIAESESASMSTACSELEVQVEQAKSELGDLGFSGSYEYDEEMASLIDAIKDQIKITENAKGVVGQQENQARNLASLLIKYNLYKGGATDINISDEWKWGAGYGNSVKVTYSYGDNQEVAYYDYLYKDKDGNAVGLLGYTTVVPEDRVNLVVLQKIPEYSLFKNKDPFSKGELTYIVDEETHEKTFFINGVEIDENTTVEENDDGTFKVQREVTKNVWGKEVTYTQELETRKNEFIPSYANTNEHDGLDGKNTYGTKGFEVLDQKTFVSEASALEKYNSASSSESQMKSQAQSHSEATSKNYIKNSLSESDSLRDVRSEIERISEAESGRLSESASVAEANSLTNSENVSMLEEYIRSESERISLAESSAISESESTSRLLASSETSDSEQPSSSSETSGSEQVPSSSETSGSEQIPSSSETPGSDTNTNTNTNTSEIEDVDVPLTDLPEIIDTPSVEIDEPDVPLAETPSEDTVLEDTNAEKTEVDRTSTDGKTVDSNDVSGQTEGDLNTIEDDEVPLGVMEDVQGGISENEVPLSDNPETGDVLPTGWVASAATAVSGLVASMKGKKKDHSKK